MTTFRSENGRGRGALPPAALPPGYLGPKEGTALGLLVAVLAAPVSAQELALPSGLSATLYDVVLEAGTGALAPDAFTDPEQIEAGDIPEDIALDVAPEEPEAIAGDAATGGLARFRLMVPGLGGEDAGYEAVVGDFLWLCEQVALPALAANGWTPTEVVVALSDREVAFGATDPEAVQFFEGFRIADGACIPQAF